MCSRQRGQKKLKPAGLPERVNASRQLWLPSSFDRASLPLSIISLSVDISCPPEAVLTGGLLTVMLVTQTLEIFYGDEQLPVPTVRYFVVYLGGRPVAALTVSVNVLADHVLRLRQE